MEDESQSYGDQVPGRSGGIVNSVFSGEITVCKEIEDEATFDNLHPLSIGKTYHLYVIHSSEDEDQVNQLAHDIEQRFSPKCMLHHRDFQPGVGIPENCQMKIAESEKVLVVLSPEYFQAYWCKEELKCAKMWSHELKRNDLIIPLILRPITDQLPPDLRYHTYINAMKEDDVAKKIYDAFLYDEKAREREDKLKKNGYRLLEMKVVKTFPKKYSGLGWFFPESIEEGDEEVRDLYEKCAKELNSKRLLRYHGLLVMGIRMWSVAIAVTLMLALTKTGIHGSLVLHYQSEEVGSVGGLLNLGDYIIASAFFGIPLGLTLGRRKMLLEAVRVVWKINGQNKEYKCLALLQWNLLIQAGCFKLVIIRYDRMNCTKIASVLVQNALFGAREHLLKWGTLKENSINHHNTWKSKQCVCDMVAPMIEDPSKDSVIITRGKVNSAFVTWYHQ